MGYSWWTICDNFRWIAKGLSHTHTRIHSSPNSPPIQAATRHWAEFSELYSRFLLVTHFKYSSVYMTIPNSLSVPPFSPPCHTPANISSFFKPMSYSIMYINCPSASCESYTKYIIVSAECSLRFCLRALSYFSFHKSTFITEIY